MNFFEESATVNSTFYCQNFWQYFAFGNGPEDQGSISGRVIPKTLKMVLDISLLNILIYKVQMKGK